MNNEEEMKEKINLAKNQNNILNCMFSVIQDGSFDQDSLNLSNIPSTKLKDFWLHTTGFLSLINYENQDNILNSDEAFSILQGDFCLKILSNKEVSETLKNCGIQEKKSGFSQHYDLYQIQDGKYSIDKNISYNRQFANVLKLNTRSLEIYSDYEFLDTEPSHLLKRIRNCLAHSVPYIDGTSLTLVSGDDDFVVSKMWLRGFAETFCMLSKTIDEKTIYKKFLEDLPLERNYIENEKDIDKALSCIKDLFDDEIKKNFYRINNFVKLRLRYESDFYKKPFEEKINSIATIIANNPNYLTSASETINPTIIYNLQQLVAKELIKRGEDAYLSDEDLGLDEIEQLKNEYEELNAKVEKFEKLNPVLRTGMQIKQNKILSNQLIALSNKFNKKINEIEVKRKLECSNMDLFDPNSLKNLSVEVAVNLVWLTAFNNLVISGFYEDLLKDEDFKCMSKTKKDFFDKFNFSKINVTYNSKKSDSVKLDNSIPASQKAFLLSCMRNSLCHGLVEYNLPPVKQGEQPTYKDALITFNTDAGTIIFGRLEDIYKLFSSDIFTKPRKPEICSWSKEDKANKETKNNLNKKQSQPNDDE